MTLFSTPFNPMNWYFLSEDGRIYSTATMSLVAASDAAFQAWQSMGLVPSPWPGNGAANQTEDTIRAQLVPYGWPCGDISLRQFFQQLAIAGIITQDEALAVYDNRRTLPAKIETVVAAMSANDAFDARMHLLGGQTVERNHPMVKIFCTSQNMTPLDIDALFRAAGALH